MEQITLEAPADALKEDYLAFCDELRQAGEERYRDLPYYAQENFLRYIHQLEYIKEGKQLPEGFVPYTTLWLLRDGCSILGISHLRHYLTAATEHEGGHIGYVIRPSARRLGYGKQLLNLTLREAREFGFSRVLVTCDTDNIGSGRIIRHNGGIFDNEVISLNSGKPVSRYWITLHNS